MSRLFDAPEQVRADEGQSCRKDNQTGRLLLGRSVKNTVTVICRDGALSLNHILQFRRSSGTGTFVGSFCCYLLS